MKEIQGKFVGIAFAFVLFVFLDRIYYCEGYNFCYKGAEKILCGSEKHTMCHDDLLPKQLELVKSIPMTQKVKSKILDIHNSLRDKVASGTETGANNVNFPKAARMREMLWDQELELVARTHARQCSFHHDDCRSTKRFPSSGQNIGKGGLTSNIDIDSILNSLYLMQAEKDLVEDPQELPKGFQPHHAEMGHFTVMIHELSSFVGCGIALCRDPEEEAISSYMLTCNYEYNNVVTFPIYKTDNTTSGSSCSDWDVEMSSNYENLCSNNGKVFFV